MSKLKKIAIIGLIVVAVATTLCIILGYHPAIAGVHALPFCMLLLIDYSRKYDRQKPDENK